MSLSALDLIAMIGVALIIFAVGRWKPTVNGMSGGMQALLTELEEAHRERDKWREAAQAADRRCQEAWDEVRMLQRLLERGGG